MTSLPVLITLSRRARLLRQQQGMTLRSLATKSGLSLRFLMDVEAGRGNISIRRLADLAEALKTTAADLVTVHSEDPAPKIVALLGVRGSGKTTIGRRLARRLKVRFVELDKHIEQRAGMRLTEIFTMHGEEFYRRLERETLTDLLAGRQSMVLAVGGGLVTAPDSYGLLLLMIMVSLVVASIPTEGRENLMAVLRTVVLAGTFLFALHTSDASRWMYYASFALIAVAVSASVIVDAGTKTGAAIDAIAALLIVLGALFVIGRRFAAHPVITGQSVLAALCIYLLFGLGYAAVYGVVGALDPVALFGPVNGAQTNLVRIYYSFITLSTVGYGDFVPYANITRMIAVTEALVGQVYLVTIVALLVSHVGHERPSREQRRPPEPNQG